MCIEDSDDLVLLMRLACEQERDFEVVGSTADPVEALRLCERIRPDVVIVDHHLTDGVAGPGASGAEGDGLALAATIKGLLPGATVAVFTGQSGIRRQVLRAGADVCVEKPDMDGLWPAIREARARAGR